MQQFLPERCRALVFGDQVSQVLDMLQGILMFLLMRLLGRTDMLGEFRELLVGLLHVLIKLLQAFFAQIVLIP